MPFTFQFFVKIPYYSCCHLPLLHSSLVVTSPASLQLLFPAGEAQLGTELSNTSLLCSSTTVSDQGQTFLGMFWMAVMGKQEWENRGHRKRGTWHEKEVHIRVLKTEGQEGEEWKQLV